eukprot:93153-Rhodomonas_salina.3
MGFFVPREKRRGENVLLLELQLRVQRACSEENRGVPGYPGRFPGRFHPGTRVPGYPGYPVISTQFSQPVTVPGTGVRVYPST